MTCAVDLKRVDETLGERLERMVVAHHRRRLRTLGWLEVLDAPGGWASGEPAPRPDNQLNVLVDGAEALPAIVREPENARSHVWFAGWHFSPELELGGKALPRALAEAAERVEVRVLAWAGAPLPSSTPPGARCARAAISSSAALGSAVPSTSASGRCTAITRSS